MDQSYYYTLSAIAQICGALVAIGGAVIVFKLNIIEKEINDYRLRIIKAILSPVTGNPETKYYFYSDDDLIKVYKDNKKNIISSNDVVNEHVVSAIQRNYGLDGKPEFWVRITFSTFLSVIRSKSKAIDKFKETLLLLISAIIMNVILLAIPFNKEISLLFYCVVFFSISQIIISSILSWQILSAKVFDFEFLEKGLKDKVKIVDKIEIKKNGKVQNHN